MKKLVKIIVAVVLLNAVGRVGWAAWNYYQLKDAAQDAVVFGAQDQPVQIQGEILRKAAALNLPVEARNVTVERQGIRTEAKARYTQTVEVFPSYQYPFTFAFTVQAVSLTGLK